MSISKLADLSAVPKRSPRCREPWRRKSCFRSLRPLQRRCRGLRADTATRKPSLAGGREQHLGGPARLKVCQLISHGSEAVDRTLLRRNAICYAKESRGRLPNLQMDHSLRTCKQNCPRDRMADWLVLVCYWIECRLVGQGSNCSSVYSRIQQSDTAGLQKLFLMCDQLGDPQRRWLTFSDGS